MKAKNEKRSHEPVLLQETIDGLDFQEGDVFVDGTLGRAGHTITALQKQPKIFVIGIDRDADAIKESKDLLIKSGYVPEKNFHLFLGNYRDIGKALESAVSAEQSTEKSFSALQNRLANKILLDIGISSPHIDSSGRGFSFMKDEPLIMTMEKPGENLSNDSFTAGDIVNKWAEEDIANVIYAYGEEGFSRRIAKAIVEARESAEDPENAIKTTGQLVEIIKSAVPGFYRNGKINPATKTFQALRIAVNDELGALKQGLSESFKHLSPSGRLAVISFHSLEDRIVKTTMKDWEKQGLGKQSTKKPIVPKIEEIKENPRSRSSKLRIFIKN